MGYRYLGIFVLLFTVTQVVNGEPASACYGTDPICDFYSMKCASNQIIRLYNLYAGHKNTTLYPLCMTSQCDNASTCCTANYTSDIIEIFNEENTYKAYTNCSGRTNCTDVHAPWQRMSSNPSLFSSYVQLEYGCEEVSGKIPFCGGPTGSYSVEGSNKEIIFDGSRENFDPLKASKECQCSVTNLGQQQNVVLKTVDIRLQTYYKRENQTYADCSSAFFQSPVFGTLCRESNTPYRENFHINKQIQLPIVAGQTVEISLKDIHKNGMKDSPAMVWISLQAAENNGFRINCREVIPANFTTTTTTTSTTSTTTTTTTTSTTTSTSTTTTPTTTTTTTSTTTSTSTTTTPTTTTTTTTTPRPTTTSTTTSTTRKPTTTTTTTTTPRPTTTSTTTSTTRKPTTSTTTTTRRPTTTGPRPTTSTTTRKPTTTTTTSTTTSTTPSTTKTTPTPLTTTRRTTTTSKTTTTSTTPRPTTPVVTPAPTTRTSTTQTTRVRRTTEAIIGKRGDGEDDIKQRTAVYLAICIPIIVCLLFITFFLLWIYWKRTSPRRKKLDFTKITPRSEVNQYNLFKYPENPKILDDFINDIGVETNSPGDTEKPPMSTFISVPEPSKRSRSILSYGSVYRPEPAQPVKPYVIPLQAVKREPLYSVPTSKARPVSKTVYVNKTNGGPVVITDTVKPASSEDLSKMNDIYDPWSDNDNKRSQEPETTPNKNILRNKPDDSDGGVLIHVDNLSLPPASARSTNENTLSSNTSSTRSEIGSTPGNLTPERRNSEPVLNIPDHVLGGHSASAHILADEN